MSTQERNATLWSRFVADSSNKEFSETRLNADLFNRMAVSACFKQCAKTDIDIVSMNEMECTYKCMITYKQALPIL
jgi:hypothetical protein